jgi:L-2,4-diaminobutyrate decarboxylase
MTAPGAGMHAMTDEVRELARAIAEFAAERLAADPPDLGASAPPEEVARLAGATITPEGLGPQEALARFTETLLPLTTAIDHPRYLAFIPSAPTPASALVDLLVSATSVYAGSWLEGAGAVHAENEALRWLADLAGLPASAGGCFVQGGTNGNISALHAAREWARRTSPRARRIACSDEVHSSIRSTARIMDVEVLPVPTGPDGRLTGAALRAALDGAEDVFAVVATAGTTNLGLVDDLAGVAEVARERGLWFHVDGAYGAAGLCAPSVRHRFAGVEHADSLIGDPHKWLFAPFDACALIYRDPVRGRAAHTQHAGYLEPITKDTEWNPSDFAVQLTRRARGLPFWFSLATHGTDAYREALERTLTVARRGRELIDAAPHLRLLVEPDLAVLVFERDGWGPEDYAEWSARLLDEQLAFVVPTRHHGRVCTRFAIVNPLTTPDDLQLIIDSMR